jgi:hypothetical protein
VHGTLEVLWESEAFDGLHNYFGRAQLLMPDMSGVKFSASDADALVPGALEKYTNLKLSSSSTQPP